MCDEREAFAASHLRHLFPDEEPTGEEPAFNVVFYPMSPSCGQSGPRYACVSPSGELVRLWATRQEAVEACEKDMEAAARNARMLGVDPGRSFASRWATAEVVAVDADTVSVIDGVVRGLVFNRSATQFARRVTVSAPLTAGGGSWVWPLTVQPHEYAPFEIAGWSGSADPAVAAAGLSVAASLSPYIDISRSMVLNTAGNFHDQLMWAKPAFVVPTSHPSLADVVLNQTVDDLRAYATYTELIGGKRVVSDVVELAPKAWVTPPGATDESQIAVRTLPIPPEAGITSRPYDFTIWIDIAHEFPDEIWVGGANPPPAGPPVLVPADPPPRTPVVPVPGD